VSKHGGDVKAEIPMRNIKESLKLCDTLFKPYIYSATALYKSIRVESVFKHMRLADFRANPIVRRFPIKDMGANPLTHKLHLLVQIAQ
jgi:hypothetical protein